MDMRIDGVLKNGFKVKAPLLIQARNLPGISAVFFNAVFKFSRNLRSAQPGTIDVAGAQER